MNEETDAAAEAAPTSCELCGAALGAGQALSVSGHTACPACVAQLEDELAGSEAGLANLPMAAAGTLVGALLGAAVWVGITVTTEYEIGYVAVLVGYLAGKGATLATGGAHGRPLQQLAAAGAVFGLLAAKYAIFAHAMKEYVAENYGETLGYLDGQVVSYFFESLGETTGLFDLLWIFFAVTTAWRVPASPTLHVSQP